TSDAEKLGWSYVYGEDGTLLGEYGSGGANSAGTAQYLYLPTASGPMPIAAVIKGQTYAIHSDHLNTPRKLTQADGQAVWQWEYSAFGDEQPTTAAKRFTSETTTPTTGATSVPEVTFNLRYPGQYFDAETKLHYNYFRSYDSRTGRYMQGDPIGLSGGFNRFGYAGGNPIRFSDQYGLQATTFAPHPLWIIPAACLATPACREFCSKLGNDFRNWMNSEGSGGNVPPIPEDLVGDQSDPRAGPNRGGGKHTSGPLTEENGGTGEFLPDLDKLTGGARPWRPGDKAPPGSLIGENGIFGRPTNSGGGQSIDIPANGKKPHETLHYP
ncbi:RHS repeat domain-containing protein, partial [Acidovorax sp. sic0104]|uniref:RHS repeat domain-containing protein n=1 Tax=Acidovorax sp. sic0104 TaxID=2854784 RepID=UPI0027152FF8